MSKKHKLGFGYGTLVEHDDGTAGYIPSASLSQAFRVRIADVTGFSVTRGHKALERTLNVLGNGTVLGSASVNHGVAEKVEAWFRGHPQFGTPPAAQTAAAATQPPSRGLSHTLIADELRKLADLRAEGVLTDEEFSVQKARLLGG
jgi:Short C-terminal domain